jgi:hypothetical protein
MWGVTSPLRYDSYTDNYTLGYPSLLSNPLWFGARKSPDDGIIFAIFGRPCGDYICLGWLIEPAINWGRS